MPTKGSALPPNQPFHLTPPSLPSVAEAAAGERRRWAFHNLFFLAQAVTTSKVSFSWGSAPPPAARVLDLARRNSESPIPR